MAIQIQLRRDTSTNWTLIDPILADGEIGLETDTKKLKAGNGTDQWSSLSYITGSGGTGATALPDLTDVADDLAYTDGFVLRADGSEYTGEQLSHTDLADKGTTTHANIDSHISSTSNPHGVTAAQVSAIPSNYLDTDTLLTADSDNKIASQKATKAYADALANGQFPKNSCRVATTTSGSLANDFENGDVVDGVTLATNDRILIKNQSDNTTNGIYTVNASGAPTRATDYDSAAEAKQGTFTYILEGTANYNTQWIQYEVITTVGSDAILFRQLPAPAQNTGSNGIKLVSGTDFQIDLSDTNPSLEVTDGGLRSKVVANGGLERTSGGLQLEDGKITNAKIADDTIDLADKVTGVLPEANGGTGESTYSKGDLLYASADDTLSKLPIGSNGQALIVGANETLNWGAGGGGGTGSVMVIPRADARKVGWANFGSATTGTPIVAVGMPTPLVVGTAAQVSDSTINGISYTTTAVSGNAAYSYVLYSNIKIRRTQNPTYIITFETGPSIAAQRIWIGLLSVTPGNADTLPTRQGYMLRYSTVAGDTTFKYVTSNGSTQTVTDSELTVKANTVYTFKVVVNESVPNAIFSLQGSYSKTVTDTLPSAVTDLGIYNWLFTTEAVAKTITFSRFYIEREGTALSSSTTGIQNVIEDETPQLGGTLDARENDIDNVGDIIHDDDTASDWTLKNEDLDKDIIISGNDGGVQKTIMKLDVSEGALSGIIKGTDGLLGPAGAGDADSLITVQKDIVCTAPLKVNDGDSLNNVLPGADADVTFSIDSNLPGVNQHFMGTIFNPNALGITTNTIVPIKISTPAALTITNIKVTTSSTSYEVAGDFKYADDRTSLANSTLIETFDTSSGVRNDSSMSGDPTIPSGKFLYLIFDSAPNVAITDVTFDITYDLD